MRLFYLHQCATKGGQTKGDRPLYFYWFGRILAIAVSLFWRLRSLLHLSLFASPPLRQGIVAPKNILGKNYALHIQDFQAMRINQGCDNFRPRGISLYLYLLWTKTYVRNCMVYLLCCLSLSWKQQLHLHLLRKPNSKIVYVCICICYEFINNSEIFFSVCNAIWTNGTYILPDPKNSKPI